MNSWRENSNRTNAKIMHPKIFYSTFTLSAGRHLDALRNVELSMEKRKKSNLLLSNSLITLSQMQSEVLPLTTHKLLLQVALLASDRPCLP